MGSLAQYLFAYGTLRQDYGLALLEKVAGQMVYIGTGHVAGQLYDLGTYPGAVTTDSDAPVIKGDVFCLRDPEAVLSFLDEYEGDEYRRQVVAVNLGSGGQLMAWIYWYTGAADNAKAITAGDYLEYLKIKKDRFL
jgi:gamma-glutamylcyclotransferase (GGCT)/AIG2-like uncharacterized protein YtfP